MRRVERASERGAALVTVLMIVAAMSVVAIGLTQTVTSATQRARALDGQAQLRLYAAAAEEVAEARLGGFLAALGGRVTAEMPGLNEVQNIPVEGGLLQVRVVDATNCFDLNRLMIGIEGGDLQADAKALKDYLTVLQGAGLSPSDAKALGAALIDWMDADSSVSLSGAENGYYAGETPSYRTSGQPLANLNELRAIRGYTPDIIEAIRPSVCVRPFRSKLPNDALNVNTLTPKQAPVLVLAFSGALELEDARGLIAARPIGGWPDIPSFFAEPSLKQISPELRRVEHLDIVTRYVEIYADVAYRGQVMNMRYLFETQPGQPVRTLRRERVG